MFHLLNKKKIHDNFILLYNYIATWYNVYTYFILKYQSITCINNKFYKTYIKLRYISNFGIKNIFFFYKNKANSCYPTFIKFGLSGASAVCEEIQFQLPLQ